MNISIHLDGLSILNKTQGRKKRRGALGCLRASSRCSKSHLRHVDANADADADDEDEDEDDVGGGQK